MPSWARRKRENVWSPSSAPRSFSVLRLRVSVSTGTSTTRLWNVLSPPEHSCSLSPHLANNRRSECSAAVLRHRRAPSPRDICNRSYTREPLSACAGAQCPDAHDIGLVGVFHYALSTEMVMVWGGPLEEHFSMPPPPSALWIQFSKNQTRMLLGNTQRKDFMPIFSWMYC